MALVFIDASSAILLYKADLFTQCAREFSMFMAPAVFREVTPQGYPGTEDFHGARDRGLIRIRQPEPDHGFSAHPEFDRLGAGESETIGLFDRYACAREPSFIIIDDGKGAKFCRTHDIPYINALLVPKIFWYSGRMTTDAFKKNTTRLLGLGRYSKQIIQQAGELTRTDLSHVTGGGTHEKTS
ncbi:MAG: hypothetical protein V6Z89_21285 [Desulfobacter sp.]